MPGQSGTDDAAAPEHRCRALLDTGAQTTGISQKVVDALGLVSDGWATVAGAHGEPKETPTFTVDIHLPISEMVDSPDGAMQNTFSRGIGSMEVTLLGLNNAGFDVLLGMDFLSSFHITVFNGTFIISN